jgi:hypothetical protein
MPVSLLNLLKNRGLSVDGDFTFFGPGLNRFSLFVIDVYLKFHPILVYGYKIIIFYGLAYLILAIKCSF